MPHFFINSNQINDKSIIISRSAMPRRQNEENYFHIARSLRSKPGEKLLLIDENQVQYETTIKEITKDEIRTQIDKSYPSKRFLDFELYLAQSPLRSDGQNFIIEKATELGVSGIYPIKTDFCTLSKSVIDKKIAKWQKIMYESSKQCERAIVPECFECTTIETLIKSQNIDKIYVFCERIATKTIRDSFNENPIKKGEKVLVIIGPEGGFSQREFQQFACPPLEGGPKSLISRRGFEMLTLGDMILRAETAVTVALGNIIYEYSNFNK
ncbi:16S rRNA (uracil(1498)-N(3))-methyltransferase [bacterium]|nr:16S rRNA (uracil(1498)-N(3))-methyltransferase [bacterium]